MLHDSATDSNSQYQQSHSNSLCHGIYLFSSHLGESFRRKSLAKFFPKKAKSKKYLTLLPCGAELFTCQERWCVLQPERALPLWEVLIPGKNSMKIILGLSNNSLNLSFTVQPHMNPFALLFYCSQKWKPSAAFSSCPIPGKYAQ